MKRLLMTASAAFLLLVPAVAQDTGAGSGAGADQSLSDNSGATPPDTAETGEAVAVSELEAGALEGASVLGTEGEEVGTVSQVITFDDSDGVRSVVVEMDNRQVEIDAMNFNVRAHDDGTYTVELLLGREAIGSLPDYQDG